MGETEQQSQQGRLARAVGSQQTKNLAAMNAKRTIAQGGKVSVPLSQRVCFQDGLLVAHYLLNKNAGLLISAQARSWTPSNRRFLIASVLRCTAANSDW